MKNTYLGLGANVGDKKLHLQMAVKYLQMKVSEIKCAPVYETRPWGYLEQGNFLNTVLSGKTDLRPEELLLFVKDVEKSVGRIKTFKNGPGK